MKTAKKTISPENLQEIREKIQGFKTYRVFVDRTEYTVETWEVKAKNKKEAINNFFMQGDCIDTESYDGEYGETSDRVEVKVGNSFINCEEEE